MNDTKYVFMGPAGSGKTTLREKLEEQYYPDSVSLDVLDEVLNHYEDAADQAMLVARSYNSLLEKVYKENPRFVEVANDGDGAWFQEVIGGVGEVGGERCRIVVVYVGAPLSVCLGRAAAREHNMPAEVVRHHQSFGVEEYREAALRAGADHFIHIDTGGESAAVSYDRLAHELAGLDCLPYKGGGR